MTDLETRLKKILAEMANDIEWCVKAPGALQVDRNKEASVIALTKKSIVQLIQDEQLASKEQAALDVITWFKGYRIKHTLGTAVQDWEREFETADRALADYLSGIRAERQAIRGGKNE